MTLFEYEEDPSTKKTVSYSHIRVYLSSILFSSVIILVLWQLEGHPNCRTYQYATVSTVIEACSPLTFLSSVLIP